MINGVRSVPLSNVPMFEGVWHGKNVRFERIFRGYSLSDEECRALCEGHAIEIHGLERHGVKYAVVGALQESMYQGLKQSFTEIKLKALKTIPYDPEYKFHIVEIPAPLSDSFDSGVECTPEFLGGRQPLSMDGISVVGMVGHAGADGSKFETSTSDDDFINHFDPAVIEAQEAAEFQQQMEQSVQYGTPQLVSVNAGSDTPRYIAVFKMLTQEQIDAAAAAAAAQPLVYDPWYDVRSA